MNKIKFSGNILLLGSGAVSRCLQVLLLRHFDIDFSKLIIIDKADCKESIKETLNKGARFIQQEINENFEQILGQYLNSGDLLIDLTTDIDSIKLIDWCQRNNILFINTSLEWKADINKVRSITPEETIYYHHVLLKEKSKEWKRNGATAIIEHGANPGLVSHWVKLSLENIAKILLQDNKNIEKNKLIQDALENKNFAKLAMITNTKVIHISERDTQITKNPKKVNEFVNTWSAVGFYEESMLPAELGWGTHENILPQNLYQHEIGPRNQAYLKQYGLNTFIQSWVPAGQIIGNLVSHGEAYTISDHLTLWQNDKAIYRPTVYFVYLPSDSAFMSIYESKMQDYTIQKNLRIMNDDIIDGSDQMGVLLLGHELNGWWTGSTLSINQTRDLIGLGHNPTTLQVAASMLGALAWMIKNPNKGLCMPDDLPYKEILEIANPYLGTISSIQTDWRPTKDKTGQWQFVDFIAD